MFRLDSISKSLPPEAKKELIDFAEFLKKKYLKKQARSSMRLSWAGGLSDLNEKFNAVNLQHYISDLWSSKDVSR